MHNLPFPGPSFDRCIKCNACVVDCPLSGASLDFGGTSCTLALKFKKGIHHVLAVGTYELCRTCL